MVLRFDSSTRFQIISGDSNMGILPGGPFHLFVVILPFIYKYTYRYILYIYYFLIKMTYKPRYNSRTSDNVRPKYKSVLSNQFDTRHYVRQDLDITFLNVKSHFL